MPTIGVEAITPTETHEGTGNNDVDALFSGYKFSADAGSSLTTLTYSFPTAGSVFSTDEFRGYGETDTEPYTGLAGVSSNVQSLFKFATENLEQFSNFVGQEVSDAGESAGTIRLAWTSFKEGDEDDTVAWAYLPGNHYVAGDIWLQSDIADEDEVDFGHTLFHELGHALGLKHSFEEENGFPALDSSLEGVDYTVMSYSVSARFSNATWADLWPQTYMYLDIKALQELYGTDMVTTGGSDTYVYDMAERYYLTIWDAGGVDTLAVSSGSKSVHLSLVPGTWSNVGTTIEYYDGSIFFTDSYSVYISDDTTLENATGASGDDTIEGNSAANKLKGNAGNDTIIGGAGSDVLTGHSGNDVQLAGGGDDQLWAGGGDLGNDTMVGGSGNDVAGGGAGNDLLVGGGFDEGGAKQLSSQSENAGGDGRDTLYGADGNDTIIGGGWDDGAVNDNGKFDSGEEIVTGTDDNVLWSGDGEDLVYGSAGHDLIGSRGGFDIVYAGEGNDTVFGGASDDRDVIFGGGGNDELYSGAGNDEVDGGAGADLVYDAVGNDRYTGGSGADTFIFASASDDDTITDFNVSEDVLNLMGAAAGFTAASDVEAAATAQGNGVIIDLGSGNSLTLNGIDVGDVVNINFVF